MKRDFINAVENKNLAKVRISLSNELLLDPRGNTFGEMLSFAMSHISDLFEENKEVNYSVPPQEVWNLEFLFEVKSDLDSNFSKEKLAFYEAVIKVVGRSKAQEINDTETKERECSEREKYTDKKQRTRINTTNGTITAGGTILTIVGICAGKTLLTVLGGVVLIVGGVMLYNDSRK